MASAAKIASNRTNAQKSCGPKTAEGKAVSRFNALQHGLTAKVAVLADEDPAALEALRASWMQTYRPRNGVEAGDVERGAYLSWQLARIERAQSAQLCHYAETATAVKADREAQETIQLADRLMRPTWEFRWGATDQATKTAEDAEQVSEERVHAAILEIQLEKTGDGCRWLRQEWNELKTILDEGRPWKALDCFKGTRLQGMQPMSIVDLPDLARFLRIPQVLAGEGSELAIETWKLLAPTDAEEGLRQFRLILAGETAPLDSAAARQRLISMIQQELERLDEKIEAHDQVSALEAELAPHRYAFDFSDDGERVRRYELACRRFLEKIRTDLKNRGIRYADPFSPVYNEYPSLRPNLLNLGRARSASGNTTGASNKIDASGAVGEAKDEGRNLKSEVPNPKFEDRNANPVSLSAAESLLVGEIPNADGTGASARTGTPRRNEANGDGEAEFELSAVSNEVGRNEANRDGQAESKLIKGAEEPMRNEAYPDDDAAMGRAKSQAAPVEVIRKHHVGAATVTRLSQATGPFGTKRSSRRERLVQRRELERQGAGR